MSSTNSNLHKLAMERMKRQTTATATVEEWSCPVCYTDGSASGHVIPKCCTHKICLECYSNILTKTTNCICPVCRAEYLSKPSDQEEQEQEPEEQEQEPAQEPAQEQEQEQEEWEDDWLDEVPQSAPVVRAAPAPVVRAAPAQGGGNISSFKMPNWLRNF